MYTYIHTIDSPLTVLISQKPFSNHAQCMYVYVYVYTCIHKINVCMYVCMCVCMYIYMHTCDQITIDCDDDLMETFSISHASTYVCIYMHTYNQLTINRDDDLMETNRCP